MTVLTVSFFRTVPSFAAAQAAVPSATARRCAASALLRFMGAALPAAYLHPACVLAA